MAAIEELLGEAIRSLEEGCGMFFRKKWEIRTYDQETQAPVIHASICTGGDGGGFWDLRTGRFTEIMLIHTPRDPEKFRRLYGIGEDEISTQY